MPVKKNNSIKSMVDGDASVVRKVTRSKISFNPEGEGYDYETALKAGMRPDKTGHWSSREPKSGQLLKGRKHKTFHKTIAGEAKAGYKIYKGKNGKYYSKKIGE